MDRRGTAKANANADTKPRNESKCGGNQVIMHATRSTKTSRRGNETESDSEYVSTVETNDVTVTGRNIATTESQFPPPIQEMLLQKGSTTGSRGSRSGTSTSVVDSHQYQIDPETTVTHTTITFSDNDSIGSEVSKPTCGAKQETTPKSVPKMVVPNASVPVMSPLLLRVNPLQRGITARLSGQHLSTPKNRVVFWKSEKGCSARYRLAPSGETPVQCTFTMPVFLARVATIQHIINTPVVNVSAFCLPPRQKVIKQEISRKTAYAHLMLPPQGPLYAEILRPLWETITFTIAYGKHVAVEYLIPKLSALKVQLIKCDKQKVKEVDSKILYRKVKQQKIEIWKTAKPHQIILTTVEKTDPQLVKRVRLEQNPLFDRFPPSCNVAEVDMYTTEQTTYKTQTSGKESTQVEKHSYVDHQLIQKWENTVHVEHRRRRIN
ncbi:hypothetical protein RB195_008831 [Necator americanus]|uniref:Uncharacterized protein n=1 Tax=Necator americanus TaxID=51031 RepID=A0ABR1CSA2_NECAM